MASLGHNELKTHIWSVMRNFIKCKTNFSSSWTIQLYCQISNISGTLVGNKIVDHSDVVGATCRYCSNYIFILNLTPGFNGLGKDDCKTRGETLSFWTWCILHWRFDGTYMYFCLLMRNLYGSHQRLNLIWMDTPRGLLNITEQLHIYQVTFRPLRGHLIFTLDFVADGVYPSEVISGAGSLNKEIQQLWIVTIYISCFMMSRKIRQGDVPTFLSSTDGLA